jgi:glycosyltransferase involved in cell wall biosynthesis
MSEAGPLVCFDGVMDAAKSGGWRVFTSTLRALSRLGEVRLAAIVPDGRTADFSDLASTVDIVAVPVSPAQPIRNIVWHATALPRLVTRIGADVLHVPTHNLLVARKVCPTVVTIHDVTEFHLARHYDPLRTLYRRFVVPRNARLADRIAAVSEWSGRDVSATLKIPKERIVVAPNGVEACFRPVAQADAGIAVRERLKIAGAYLLYVGQIHMPNKNLVRLVQAFAAVRDRLPAKIELVLAGREVAGGDEVRAAIRACGVENSVRMVGYVPDELLPSLYSAARAFCFPSLQEGFGLPVLEAMRCGTPVITSKTTALAEIGRGAALLVDPYQTEEIAAGMIRVIRDEAFRSELREAGLARARQYTWDTTAVKLAAVYRSLAGRATS